MKLCNILVLRCIGDVEPNSIVITMPKSITKLGFSFGLLPQLRTPMKFPIFFISFRLFLCGWFYKFKIPLSSK